MSTSINITEGVGALTGLLLNIAELEKNTEYTKIGYCTKVDTGVTQEGKPFFKFNILDKAGHSIVGRMFNIEDVESKGITANNLKSSVVKIRFSLSTFGGVNSLTIYSIDPVPETALSKEEFIGELQGVAEDVKYVTGISTKVCEEYVLIGSLISKYQLLQGINTVTMPDMMAERKGGAVKFSASLMKMVEATFNNRTDIMAIVLLSEIFMYWKYAANYEENILSLGDNINTLLAKSDKYLDAVMKTAKEKDIINEYNICKEAKHLLKCYFGYDEPKTFIALTLCSFRDSLLLRYRLEEEDDSMLSGTYKTIQLDNGEFKQIVKL